jgi:uncharacterized membrane protein YoaK (UPF0700 family)
MAASGVNPADDRTGSQNRVNTLTTSATLAAAGGFLDAFTYVGHGHVFANAMTGNVVLMGVDVLSGSWRESMRHLLPISMFLCGIAAARALRLPRARQAIRSPELVVLAVEALILLALGFLPASTPDAPMTMTIAFAASLQLATFREINGHTYSSTFTTGNLRTMIESGFDWLFAGRDPLFLRRTRDFATICAMFLLGAVVGAFATPRLGNHTLWIDVVALAFVYLWLVRAR